MRRRDGEKLSLFRHDLPLPLLGATAEDDLAPVFEISSALPEPWAATGTESERGA